MRLQRAHALLDSRLMVPRALRQLHRARAAAQALRRHLLRLRARRLCVTLGAAISTCEKKARGLKALAFQGSMPGLRRTNGAISACGMRARRLAVLALLESMLLMGSRFVRTRAWHADQALWRRLLRLQAARRLHQLRAECADTWSHQLPLRRSRPWEGLRLWRSLRLWMSLSAWTKLPTATLIGT